eukprot:CAMPEP_0169128328 /NCGR_PEP_ID=MMETSP1015-20121227/36506_1 /TAXON_ID=342587 /ORGANISM="Karlodinium micrum, Strain CCMP2283" /LENGTH=199 /DNA_ID=CAMNT_0009192217 /DNA_START=133 /DNA_END=732 /DNA_ORIENTATION=-
MGCLFSRSIPASSFLLPSSEWPVASFTETLSAEAEPKPSSEMSKFSLGSSGGFQASFAANRSREAFLRACPSLRCAAVAKVDLDTPLFGSAGRVDCPIAFKPSTAGAGTESVGPDSASERLNKSASKCDAVASIATRRRSMPDDTCGKKSAAAAPITPGHATTQNHGLSPKVRCRRSTAAIAKVSTTNSQGSSSGKFTR